MCGDLSALKKPEMQIFHWFSFPNFPFVQLSPSPFLGSISMFKTFMHGHLCMVNFLHLETRDGNFPLIQFSELSVGSVFPITHPRFHFRESRDANFPLIQFSEFSIGLVFPVTHPRFCFNV